MGEPTRYEYGGPNGLRENPILEGFNSFKRSSNYTKLLSYQKVTKHAVA
jgi:hypothetical protein